MHLTAPTHSTALLVAATLLGSGCAWWDSVNDYWNNVATEAVFLGVDDPDVAELLGSAAAVTAFVAEAESLSDVESNLLDDAERIWLTASGMNEVDLSNEGSGLYLALSSDDANLEYQANRAYTLSIRGGDSSDVRSVTLNAPPQPTLSGVPVSPATHTAGQDMTVGLGREYDNYVAVVVDLEGNFTYDNRPEGVSEYLDWFGSGDAISEVTIPGSAFPNADTGYILAIAGVDKARDADFNDLNKLVSNFAAGAFAAEDVLTAP